jgi:hypothetical protein
MGQNGTAEVTTTNTVSTISLKSYIAKSTNRSTNQTLLITPIIQVNNINTYPTCYYAFLDLCCKTGFKMTECVGRLGLNKKTGVRIV